MVPVFSIPTHTTKRGRLRCAGCIAAVVLVVTLVAGALVLAYFWFRGSLEAKVEAHEARIRDQGFPVTLEEVQRFYPEVPDAENAAVVYQEAFSHLARLQHDQWDRFLELLEWSGNAEHSQTYDEAHQLSAEVFLDAAAPLFDALDRASQRSRSRFPMDLTRGNLTEFPHLRHLRDCANVLSVKGWHAAHKQDFNAFVQSQLQMLHIAESIRMEPLVISQLVRMAIHQCAAQSLANALGVTAITQEALLTLQRAYADAEDPSAVARAIAGERAMDASDLDMIVTGDTDEQYEEVYPLIDAAKQFSFIPGSRTFWVYHKIGLYEYYDRLRVLLSRPWPERVVEARALREEEHSRSTGLFFGTDQAYAILTFARDPATLRMAQAALAIERFRLDHAALPESLDELVPDYIDVVPEDPYDGAPLRYRRTDPGYFLYSVYMDQKDDGGVNAVKDDKSNWFGDWIFEVRR